MNDVAPSATTLSLFFCAAHPSMCLYASLVSGPPSLPVSLPAPPLSLSLSHIPTLNGTPPAFRHSSSLFPSLLLTSERALLSLYFSLYLHLLFSLFFCGSLYTAEWADWYVGCLQMLPSVLKGSENPPPKSKGKLPRVPKLMTGMARDAQIMGQLHQVRAFIIQLISIVVERS
jgi:hypothetical protein